MVLYSSLDGILGEGAQAVGDDVELGIGNPSGLPGEFIGVPSNIQPPVIGKLVKVPAFGETAVFQLGKEPTVDVYIERINRRGSFYRGGVITPQRERIADETRTTRSP